MTKRIIIAIASVALLTLAHSMPDTLHFLALFIGGYCVGKLAASGPDDDY